MNLTVDQERVLALITAVAEVGAPCPISTTIEKALGLGQSRLQTILGQLSAGGVLRVEYLPTNKNRRRIAVLALGRCTDWTHVNRNPPPRWAGGLVGDADDYMAVAMAGRRYEDVPAALFDDCAAVRIYRAPTYVASQSSAA
jgi:hypothetical protein